MSAISRAQEVLQFWFGLKPYAAAQVAQRSRLWFGDPSAPEITPQTDELIKERFGALIVAAAGGELSAWEVSPRRRLALIPLLLDQFPRVNVYRGRAAAFAQDSKALALAVSGMQFGADAALDPLERLFFYMPLTHAESLEVQEESVAAFRRACDEAAPDLRPYFDSSLQQAVLHRDIIARALAVSSSQPNARAQNECGGRRMARRRARRFRAINAAASRRSSRTASRAARLQPTLKSGSASGFCHIRPKRATSPPILSASPIRAMHRSALSGKAVAMTSAASAASTASSAGPKPSM